MIDQRSVVIIGGGPAGLMTADRLSAQGVNVHIYDRMPTLGRKFLQAGKGGLNLTHSEPANLFLNRFHQISSHHPADFFSYYLNHFSAQDMRDWARSLGVETFIGSSGRIFPIDMKAAPLLRSWLHRLRKQGVVFHTKHRWLGWQNNALCFEHENHKVLIEADYIVFALGGASWSHLGSDGKWIEYFVQQGIKTTRLLPANCGFQVDWEDWFIANYAGKPVKQVAIDFQGQKIIGEWVITQKGVEGSLIYALSAKIRDYILEHHHAVLYIDLIPYQTVKETTSRLALPKGKRSWSQYLKKTLGIDGVRYALLKHLAPSDAWHNTIQLAHTIHQLPITLHGIGLLDEAISTAGGVDWSELDKKTLMLHSLSNYYCVGEMLDWEAPTGGYLLTMSMATAVVVAEQILDRLGISNGRAVHDPVSN